jgi:peroxiredoxin
MRLGLIVVLTALLAACASYAVPLPALDGAKPAPDLTLPTPDGGTLALSDLRGKVVFVNFWGTYCPPCVDEMPALQTVYDQLSDQGLVVVGVNVEEKPDKVSAWARQHGITFPIALSDDGTINPVLALRRMPTTWFVDANGILRGNMVGQMDVRTARRVADLLLAESHP